MTQEKLPHRKELCLQSEVLKHLRVCRVQKGIGISMDKKKTGNLIWEARQRKNYTQSELGRMLGVTNKAVSRWENGVSHS